MFDYVIRVFRKLELLIDGVSLIDLLLLIKNWVGKIIICSIWICIEM